MRHVLMQSYGAVSSLGKSSFKEPASLEHSNCLAQRRDFEGRQVPVFPIEGSSQPDLEVLQANTPWDRAVLLGVIATEQLSLDLLGSEEERKNCRVVMGSSRGAAGTYEQEMARFINEGSQAIDTRTSPRTTMGCFASAVADAANLQGEQIDLSMTCSSGLLAVSMAHSDLTVRPGAYLAGGTESPLTPFSIAQMSAIGIYSSIETCFPCRPLCAEKNSSFVLGEGAAVALLNSVERTPETGSIVIAGCGVSRDKGRSVTGISKDGLGFQIAMSKALVQAERYGICAEDVDVLIPHAPGTRKGDFSEAVAIREVFKNKIPPLYTAKWLTGHTLGASGVLALSHAVELLRGAETTTLPFEGVLPWYQSDSTVPKAVLLNAAGFGGTTVSVLVARL